MLNGRISVLRRTRRSLFAIGLCVAGIFVFVTIAALYATETPIGDGQLITVLVILAVVAIILTALWAWLRARMGALFYIVAAGIMYGFVATLAKVVLSRIRSGDFEWLTIVCIVALLAGTAIGAYFVQTAYASGPPDLVIAGLTVIDPIVAIIIGLTVLREAEGAPWGAYVGFVAAVAPPVAAVFRTTRWLPPHLTQHQEQATQTGGNARASPGYSTHTPTRRQGWRPAPR